jgi:predicted ATPase
MIQQIRIQNFRSLKDVTLDLQQVNLLIGPNNSGKTNALKALGLLGKYFSNNRQLGMLDDAFRRNFFVADSSIDSAQVGLIAITIRLIIDEIAFVSKIELYNGISSKAVLAKNISDDFTDVDFSKIFDDASRNEFTVHMSDNELNDKGLRRATDKARTRIEDTFKLLKLYKIDPAKFTGSTTIEDSTTLDEDGSNIVSFIFSLSQNYKKKFEQLEKDLKRCVGDIVSVSTPPDPIQKGSFKLKFFDAYDNDYWADEVSEGVLYFLAILCIINQPDPPKLLLLEEPEKGIHPRRIREVMDFIFDLAYDKGIQVIMTTHDTYVVDQFADIPEAVFVFDKKDGATEVKNLQKDIIEPADQLHTENGLPPTNYTRSLGEHWAAGFLGGVPR